VVTNQLVKVEKAKEARQQQKKIEKINGLDAFLQSTLGRPISLFHRLAGLAAVSFPLSALASSFVGFNFSICFGI